MRRTLARSFSHESVVALTTRRGWQRTVQGYKRVHKAGSYLRVWRGRVPRGITPAGIAVHSRRPFPGILVGGLRRSVGRPTSRPASVEHRRRRRCRCMGPEHSRVLYIIDKRPYREPPLPLSSARPRLPLLRYNPDVTTITYTLLGGGRLTLPVTRIVSCPTCVSLCRYHLPPARPTALGD